MSRKTQTMLGVLALLLALVSGVGAYWFLGTFAATTTVPVPCQIIPAGALISPALLEDREVPRTLLQEPIYTKVDDLLGKVAQVPLYPGIVVYHHYAVPLREYRFVDDPSLVVVSLPVDPARAVGGQIQPGHRVDLWQLPQTRGQREEETTTPLTATLVLSDVLVVDVRANQGQAVARRPQAVPGQVQSNTSQNQSGTANVPLQILTVALPVNQTSTLMDWVAAEENGLAVLWVTLAPVVRPTPLAPPATSVEAMEVVAKTLTPAPTNTPSPLPTPTATLAATPTPLPSYRVTSTESALQVREEPPQGTVLGSLPEGTVVFALAEPRKMDDGTLWYHITTEGNGITLENPITGWVSGAYLEAITP